MPLLWFCIIHVKGVYIREGKNKIIYITCVQLQVKQGPYKEQAS